MGTLATLFMALVYIGLGFVGTCVAIIALVKLMPTPNFRRPDEARPKSWPY